jgi:hypothetical protein
MKIAGRPLGGHWRIGPSIKRSVGRAGSDVNGSKRRHVAQVNFVHAGRPNDYRLSGIGRSRLKGYWEPGVPFALAMIFGFGAAIAWLWDELR